MQFPRFLTKSASTAVSTLFGAIAGAWTGNIASRRSQTLSSEQVLAGFDSSITAYYKQLPNSVREQPHIASLMTSLHGAIQEARVQAATDTLTGPSFDRSARSATADRPKATSGAPSTP